MAKLKLDLHDIYNNSKAIDKALNDVFEEAIEKKIREVEIIPGKRKRAIKKKSRTVFTATAYQAALSSYRERQQKFRKVVCIF